MGKTLEERRALLEARLGELEERRRGIREELLSHESSDWEDLAQEREEDEVLEDMGNAANMEIRMIRAALARIDEGEYGYCAECGAPIGEARLDLLPATPFCAECAARHDR